MTSQPTTSASPPSAADSDRPNTPGNTNTEGVPIKPFTFSQEDKVQILLAEYASLRTEITNRTNNGYQLMTIGGALVVFLLSRVHETSKNNIGVWRDWPFWICLTISLAAIGCGTWFTMRDIRKAHDRIVEIEHDINTRAGETDLQWETRWGGMTTGYWGRSRPIK